MIEAKFKTAFGALPKAVIFTPGRVNLIGEHTDYNGGMVLPTAIALGIDIALSPRADDKIKIHSDKFDSMAERSLTDNTTGDWSDYVAGAVIFARQAGLLENGVDIAIATNLPIGAGLSSSAAIIVGILKAGRTLSGANMPDAQIAKLARRVENEFIDVPCGIMDQMAVAIARPGQALALDTQTLDYDLIDLPKDYQIAVIHSSIFRELSEGRYKTRKEECDVVKTFLGRKDICRIENNDLERLIELPEHIQRRAKHCMSENQRTLDAISALKNKNMKLFGNLMNASHLSMQDDFEISLPKIDRLVEDAQKLGAKGARLTGGGFGGCIVACIEKEKFASWVEALLARHPDAFLVC